MALALSLLLEQLLLEMLSGVQVLPVACSTRIDNVLPVLEKYFELTAHFVPIFLKAVYCGNDIGHLLYAYIFRPF